MRNSIASALSFLLVVSACGTDGEIGNGDSMTGDVGDPLPAAVEEDESISFASTLVVGDYARVCNCSALNQRSGPGTGYSVLRSMPSGSSVRILAVSGSWFKNDWSGKVGWSYGGYLCEIAPPSSGTGFTTSLSRNGIIQNGKAAVGFSYWWGGAAFANGGAHGACYGSCGDCTHSGSYGGDCSGFAGKAWMLPNALPMSSNKHPYSTYHFYNQSNYWYNVARSNAYKGDALVYRSSSGGHIVIFESGDGWGSMWTYEARGCSYGIVHNSRTCSSSYKAIRRDGV